MKQYDLVQRVVDRYIDSCVYSFLSDNPRYKQIGAMLRFLSPEDQILLSKATAKHFEHRIDRIVFNDPNLKYYFGLSPEEKRIAQEINRKFISLGY